MNSYRIFILDTFFGVITATTKKQAYELFNKNYMKMELKKDGMKDHDWYWKEVPKEKRPDTAIFYPSKKEKIRK